MPISDGKIQLKNANADTIEISLPNYGYKTNLIYPFDIIQLDDGSYDAFDNGASYDIRQCIATFQLTAAEAQTFNNFMKTTGASYGRAQELELSMNTDSGFFPFGADKGDAGPFDIALQIMNHRGQGETPYKFFTYSLRFTNVGAYPGGYTPPSVASYGNFTIGTVANLRFPINWFKSATEYAQFIAIEQGSTAQYIDRGSGGDNYQNNPKILSSESKMSAVIIYLTATARAEPFNITAGTDHYAFDRDNSGSGTYSVRLINDTISITHQEKDIFEFSLKLSYISGP